MKIISYMIYPIDANTLARKNNKFCDFLNRIINNCHIDNGARIPKSTLLYHQGSGVVIGRGVKLGENVKIYQNVTIGTIDGVTFPKIGNNVTIYPNAILMGNISVGDNSIIGAGSSIDANIPPDSLAFNENKITIKSLKIFKDYIKNG